MSRKDNFIKEELLMEEPFSFERNFLSSQKRTIGKLGNGILRPKYRSIGIHAEPKVTLPISDQKLFRLTDKDSTERLSQQIATSIQNRIDKAALKNKEQEAELQPSSKKSTALSGILIIGGIIVTGILIYVFRRSATPKLKTVKA